MFLSPRIRPFLNSLLQPAHNTTYGISSGLVDIILFDSASLDSADTLALASSLDASILVIDAGKEDAMMLRKAYTVLHRLSCTPLGAIINRQKHKHRSYFYAHPSHPFVPTQEDEQAIKIISSSISQPIHSTQNISPSLIQPRIPAIPIHAPSAPTLLSRPTTNQNFSPILNMPHTDHISEKYKE
jgi:Mrp family chromosome partitioning ATPase